MLIVSCSDRVGGVENVTQHRQFALTHVYYRCIGYAVVECFEDMVGANGSPRGF
jgi:hypothetical protein